MQSHRAQWVWIATFPENQTPIHGELPNSPEYGGLGGIVTIAGTRDLIILFVHVIVTVVRLAGPGGLRSVVAESALIRYQLLILNRGRKRAPNLRATDHIAAGLFTPFPEPGTYPSFRHRSEALHLAPSSRLLRKRKYRLLFSPQLRLRPGPKGPNQELIDAVVAMKRRNSGWGCPRIAEQIAVAFGVEIDKDVVRRILSARYRPELDSAGPSWLTFLGHMKGQSVEL